jgi:hypothetical protein
MRVTYQKADCEREGGKKSYYFQQKAVHEGFPVRDEKP